MSRRTTRRSFMKTSALAGVGVWVAGPSLAQESKSANEQINFACVGVGGKGRSDSADAKKRGNVVAICDIDENTLNGAARGFSGAKMYSDYRKMLDEMGKTIDAVTVSTPDHMHAPVSAAFMRMGKHCFTQKPLTHSIHEARVLAEVARENKLATQMGNQGTAEAGVRRAAVLLQNGALGKVKEVHVWTNRPVWPQGDDRPTDTPPVPSHIHWDEFVGGAPYRPYHPAYHPFKWRGWWVFGTGALGDMACHTLNMPFMGLDLRDPLSLEAVTSGHNKETYPTWSVIKYDFPDLNGREALSLKWYDGGKLPERELFPDKLAKSEDGKEKIASSGCLIIGEKGSLYSPNDYGAAFELFGGAEGVSQDVEFERPPGDHFDEWVRAIKEGVPARSNFPDYATALTETVLLGNLAVWLAQKPDEPQTIKWDAKNMKVTNHDGLEPMIKHEYREGYSV